MKLTPEEIKNEVRKAYSQTAQNQSCCGPSVSSSCCAPQADSTEISSLLGYSDDEIKQGVEGSNLGLGCGNPQALAGMKKGETVLDLGCGAGFDSFLAAKNVGDTGNVIGVDMTPEMIYKARENLLKSNYDNIEFRLGELENLPVADNLIDVIISNCVINLSPEKEKVFQEAFRVLKSGGRLAISDVMTISKLPEEIKNDPQFMAGCVSGAESKEFMENTLRKTGFVDVSVDIKTESKDLIEKWFPGNDLYKYIASGTIEAKKP
ncbi:MAG: arsenite methyltransferase [Spirochaetia bacterium]|nr:arsenite methyltransferase [Spirochaetia bacterium]